MRYPELRTLETGRLVLRRLVQEDAADYFARLGSSEAVTRYMLWNPHQTIADSEASIQKALRRYSAGKCYRWAIAKKHDHRVIGIFELLGFDETESRCSFAYMLGEAWWGLGYGTEVMNEAFRFAFEEMQIRKITVDHFTENAASGTVMRKAGMRHVGTRPAAYEKNGVIHDAECYELTREEWEHDHQRIPAACHDHAESGA